MPYEERGKEGGRGLSGLLGSMADEFEQQSERAVARVYCSVHGQRPTLRFGRHGTYRIDACCKEAAQRAQTALTRG
jgi:hypothetical protein